MAAWTDPPYSALVAGKAWTDAKAQAAFENVVALAEGATGAPKIKRVVTVSGAAAATQTFTGLLAFSGIEFDVVAYNTSGSAGNLQIAYSTDGGSTWSTAVTFASVAASSGHHIGHGHFDFATGALGYIGKEVSVAGATGTLRTSTTVAGASIAINAIRLTTGGSGLVALIRPNGGTV